MAAADRSLAGRAVLWDLDGTLADSSAFHWRSWQSALAAEAVTITEADFRATFGQRNEEILRLWLGADTPLERIRRVGEAKETAYRALLAAEGLTPLPGAAEWVSRLHAQGWRQAIASSAPRLNVAAMCRALPFTALIEAAVAAEDVTRGKPHPDVFLLAAAQLGTTPQRCVVAEDAAAGIEAARRAGMRTIGVGQGDVGRADVVVATLAELPASVFDELVR